MRGGRRGHLVDTHAGNRLLFCMQCRRACCWLCAMAVVYDEDRDEVPTEAGSRCVCRECGLAALTQLVGGRLSEGACLMSSATGL